MNVRCASCKTVYRVDPGKVPAAGIRARCAVCSGTIVIAAGAAEAPLAAVPAAEPAAAAPAPAAPAAPRLSQPFFQPRISRDPGAPPAAAPPARPSAPVFRPTPGQPMTAPPPAPAAAPPAAPPAAPVIEEVPQVVETTPAPQPAPPVAPAAAAPAAPAAAAPPAAPAPPATPAAEPGAPKKPINPFLQRDPKQKARRLARALVSDMIVYQPEKRQQALAAGTIQDEFSEEIQKSWEEYVEQVGEEMASSTDFWKEALNDILADGQSLF